MPKRKRTEVDIAASREVCNTPKTRRKLNTTLLTRSAESSDALIERLNALSTSDLLANYADTRRLHCQARRLQEDERSIDAFTITLYNPTRDLEPLDYDAMLEACFSLISLTSSPAYRASAQGWRPQKKKDEMREQDMRYLIVNSPNTPRPEETGDSFYETIGCDSLTPTQRRKLIDRHWTKRVVGFLSFMLTHEGGLPVLYIYEIHLRPELHGLGIGTHLLMLAHSIAENVGLEKTMLTVFRSNTRGRALYEKCGFAEDECSPKKIYLRGGKVKKADYVIMSKTVVFADDSEDFLFQTHGNAVQDTISINKYP
ncbi:N alpha-acetyl-transferase [Elasticomyces elasticus]|nr:N alpha-acetyl-transferase [Elasticomyces elasticus]